MELLGRDRTICGRWFAEHGAASRPFHIAARRPAYGIESLVGAAAGGAFAGSASAEALKLLLGLILIAAAFKAFWRHP